MVAIPGIIALLTFIYLRPQEVSHTLRTLPFLHIFLGMTVVGFLIDVGMRKLQPKISPQLRWAVLFLFWCVITMVVKVPSSEIQYNTTLLLISFALFAVIAHAMQTFRSFSLVASVVVGLCLILAAIGVHQSQSPRQCIVLEPGVSAHLGEGTPDGRSCETYRQCYDEESEADKQYICERVGLLGTTTIQGRVRYRGVLQDPNELALVVCIGLPFMFALASRRRKAFWYVLSTIGTVLMFFCVIKTQSRSGQLAFLGVLGVYFIKRYGKAGVLLGGIMALPLVLAGGRGGSEASQSTIDRYEAWRAGIDMIRESPLIGVGQSMFTDSHHLTAHNSYLLAGAELGFLGLFLWMMVLYVSFKMAYRGMKLDLDDDRAEEARVWGTAVFAALVGFAISMLFLSLSYHNLLWIYLGLAGAYWSVLRAQWPNLELGIGIKDYALVFASTVGIIAAVSFVLRFKGY